jgi:hypothetical protein
MTGDARSSDFPDLTCHEKNYPCTFAGNGNVSPLPHGWHPGAARGTNSNPATLVTTTDGWFDQESSTGNMADGSE